MTGPEQKKEPLNLKIILPLAGVILLLALVFVTINFSKSSYLEATTPQLVESFNSFALKNKSFDHFKLFVSEKSVTWEQGPSLAGFLQDLSGSEAISTVALGYQIPVFINLTGDWIFNKTDDELMVQAPMPIFGDAVLDPTTLQIKFKSSVTPEQESLIRETLTENLASYRVALDSSSRASLQQESRTQLQELLKNWLDKNYSNIPDIKFKISFSGSDDPEFPEEP